MGKIVESTLELIGNTPLLKADRYAKATGATKANILVKLEYQIGRASCRERV